MNIPGQVQPHQSREAGLGRGGKGLWVGHEARGQRIKVPLAVDAFAQPLERTHRHHAAGTQLEFGHRGNPALAQGPLNQRQILAARREAAHLPGLEVHPLGRGAKGLAGEQIARQPLGEDADAEGDALGLLPIEVRQDEQRRVPLAAAEGG